LYEKALTLSIKLSDTKNILDLTSFLKYPEEKIEQIVKEVVVRLAEHPGDGESLGLAYEYLHDYEDAAKIYLKF
jgi:hypothetical protein